MLKHLSIKNYAIIEKVELKFNDGFTVITGETGAGKSILLGALSLVLGKRVDSSVLNNKEKKCIIEAEFAINSILHEGFFNKYDIDYEEIKEPQQNNYELTSTDFLMLLTVAIEDKLMKLVKNYAKITAFIPISLQKGAMYYR